MKTEREIKVLLSGVSNPDASEDEEIKKAWEQVKTNDELMQWFKAQQQFDAGMADVLKRIEVPDGFEQEILESCHAATRDQSSVFAKWFQHRWIVGAIAAMMVLMGGVFVFKNTLINNQNFGYLPSWSAVDREHHFRDAMAVFVDETKIQLDYLSGNRHSIQQWLVGHGGANLKRFPTSFDELEVAGCKTLKWRGRTVSLICFPLEDGHIVHLFVLDRKGTAEALIEGIDGIERVRGLETAGWLTPSHAVLIVASDPSVDIGSFVDQSSI